MSRENVIKNLTVRVLDSDGAQTDAAAITAAETERIVVTRVTMTAADANTGAVNCTVGFAAATLPTPDTGGAGDGVVADFLGMPSGGGLTVGNGSGVLGAGALGQDLRYTCEDPAGGSISISITYYILTP